MQHPVGWLQVPQQGQQGQGFLVFLALIAGEAPQDIPDEAKVGGASVAQQGNILAGRDALLHAFEQGRGEGLDAGLNVGYSGSLQQDHLFQGKIGFLFVE